MTICRKQRLSDKSVFMEIKNRPNPNEAFPNPKIPSLCFIKNVVKNPRIIIIPKTTHKERMVENIKLFDFTLSDEDLREICLLDTGRNVTGWPSDALKYNPESV